MAHRELDTIIPQLSLKDGFIYTLLAPTTIIRTSVYLIEAKGVVEEWGSSVHVAKINGQNVESFSPDEKEKVNIDDVFYIDQNNFHLLRRKSTNTSPEFTILITQTIKHEVLDVPIPESAFVFKILNGVKEWKKAN